MSLSTLKAAAYDILQVPALSQASFDASLLLAFNSARLSAERNHDFVLSKGVGYVTVAASGGNGVALSTAQASFTSEAPSGSTVAFKSVERVDVRQDGTAWVRGSYVPRNVYEAQMDRSNRLLPFPCDWQDTQNPAYNDAWDSRLVVWHEGGRLYSAFDTATALRVWGSLWLPTYADFSAPDDFLITYGPDYLLWSAIVFLNHKTATYVGRNEGSIDPSNPRGMRDEAWESLLRWDQYQSQTSTDVLAEG